MSTQSQRAKITMLVLGSGTSQGVPAIGCECPTCTSTDPRDNRLRPSVLLQVSGKNIVVDTSSDFRRQMLRYHVTQLDAVLYTHHHFDHIGGFDDVRQFNFIHRGPIACYGMKQTLDEIRTTFRYAFGSLLQEGGGVPQVEMREIEEGMNPIDGIAIEAITVMHGKLPVFGFRIGSIAYVTDTNYISSEAIARLQHLDVIILDALRHEKHQTHFSLNEAIDAARAIGAKQTYFTHIAHDIHHQRDSAFLPSNMAFAHDGLEVSSEKSEGSRSVFDLLIKS